MGSKTSQLQTRFPMTAMAVISVAAWLAGSAGADPITPPAAEAAGAARTVAYAAGADAAMSLGIQLFVGAILLIASICLVWLLYLMITSPPDEDGGASAAGTAENALQATADPPSAGVAALLRLWPRSALPYFSAGGGDSLTRVLAQLVRAWIGARLGTPGAM